MYYLILFFVWAEIGMSHFEFNIFSQKMNYFSDLKLDCSIPKGWGVSVSIFGFKISYRP